MTMFLSKPPEPRTDICEELGYLVTERIVPWWPHRGTQRRKRPVFVRIELDRTKIRELSPEEILG